MKYLIAIFLLFAVIGLATEYKGAGLISLAMAAFTFYASRKFDKDDEQFLREPRSAEARPVPNTLSELEKHGCECIRNIF